MFMEKNDVNTSMHKKVFVVYVLSLSYSWGKWDRLGVNAIQKDKLKCKLLTTRVNGETRFV